MNFIKKSWQKLIVVFFTLITPVFTLYADSGGPVVNPGSGGKIINPLAGNGVNSIPDFIQTILTGALKIGIPVIALAIIYSGFLFVFARGNSEKLGKAKEALLYTLIGAAILLGSWAIATMIQVTVTGLGS